ncbi:MAG: glycoside hydrolase family 3 N-terminal domain-containing protein [Candidatus Saccharimonadales bacterium]
MSSEIPEGVRPNWPSAQDQETSNQNVAPQGPGVAAQPRIDLVRPPQGIGRRVGPSPSLPEVGGPPDWLSQQQREAQATSEPEGIFGFQQDEESEKNHKIIKRLAGVSLAVSLVGGVGAVGYDFATTGGERFDKVLTKVFRTQTGATPSVDKTPALVTTTSPAPTKEPTPSTTISTKTATPKPTKQVVVPIVPAASSCVEKLSDATLVAQKIMAPVQGNNLKAMTNVFNDQRVGGAILMTSPANPNDGSILAFKKSQTIGIEVAVDQEGGNPADKTKAAVSRIKAPVSALEPKGYMPTAADMAKLTPAQISALVDENYSYLKKIGINTSFGTVVDVAPLKGSTNIGASRVASSDPIRVATYAAAYIAGAKLSGVNPVTKHWGMGSASANTDKSPAVTPSYDQLVARDFTVYTALQAAGVEVDGMIGSEIIPGLTIDAGKDKKLGTSDDIKTPASLSGKAVSEFKADLTKGAITYTDDLGTPAIAAKQSVAEASVAAWKAGVDIALFVQTSKLPKSTVNMTVPQQINATIKTGEAALKNDAPLRQQFVASVTRLMLEKHVDGCKVLQSENPSAYKTVTAPKPVVPKTPKPASTTALPKAAATATQKVVISQTTKVVSTSK